MKKNKQLLSEVRRMQQLAGIRPLNEEDMDMEEASGMDMDQAVAEGGNLIGNDRDTEVKLSIAIDNALEAGKEVTIQGAPVEMSGNHAAIMSDGSHIRWQNISLDDVLADGQPIDISTAKAAPKDSQSFADRFGPGGGQNTAMGRRTFD